MRKINFIVVIILIQTIITSYLAVKLNIWRDEAYTLNTTAGSFYNTIIKSIEFEGQPPGYFLIIWLWRKINEHYIFARFFSIINISASIYFFYLTAKRFVEEKHALVITAIYAFNPFVIWAALEIRLYGFSLLLTSVLVYLFYEIFIFKQRSSFLNKVYLIIYIIVSIIALNTFYLFSILLFVNGILLIITKQFKHFLKYSLLMLLPILSLLYGIKNFSSQLDIHNNEIGFFSNVRKFEESFYYFFSLEIIYKINYFFRWLIRIIIFIFLTYCVLRLKTFFKQRTVIGNLLFPLQLLISLILFFIIRYTLKLQLEFKHLFIVFYFLIFSLFLNIDFLKKPIWKTITICTFILYFFKIIQEYLPPIKVENYPALIEYIEKNEKNNEPILIYRNELAEPLFYHYSGLNKLYPLPARITEYTLVKNVISNKPQIDSLLKNAIPYSETYWYISDSSEMIYGVSFNLNMINTYLKENFNIVKEIKFEDNSTRHLNSLILKKVVRKKQISK